MSETRKCGMEVELPAIIMSDWRSMIFFVELNATSKQKFLAEPDRILNAPLSCDFFIGTGSKANNF